MPMIKTSKIKIFYTTLVLILMLVASLMFANSKLTKQKSTLGDGPFFMAACYIFNVKLEIVRRLSQDYICIPTSDGGWLSANIEKLVRRAPDGETIWQKSGYYSHRIQLLSDNSVIVFFSENKKFGQELMRFDQVQKLDYSTGEVLKTFSVYEDLFLNPKVSSFKAVTDVGEKQVLALGVKHEGSHLNAISVAKDKLYVSDSHRPTIVLDLSLKFEGIDTSIIKKLNLGMAFEDAKHDVQYFDDGRQVVFLNAHSDKLNKSRSFRIFEFDGDKIKFQFPNRPEDFDETFCCGGVEKIGQIYLVGYRAKGGESSVIGFVSKGGRWLMKRKIPIQIQEIKKISVENYLSLNKI